MATTSHASWRACAVVAISKKTTCCYWERWLLVRAGPSSFGGREGIRAPDPLLANKAGQNTNGFVDVAYTENQRNFRSLKCPEVVPN